MKKAFFIAIIALACTQPKKSEVSKYPATDKGNVIDTLFGTTIADPYRWLENDTSKQTADWVAAENEVTFGYLKSIPFRDAIRKRLDELQNYERLSAPHREGDYYYYSKNSGLQNHNVQYRKKGDNGIEEVFLDPNTFSKDGTTALAGMTFSKDGSLVTLMIQEGGSDWRKAVTLTTSDKKVIGDTLRDIKFGGVAWHGNEGFYYSRYDNPKGNKLFSTVNFNKVCFHKLNTPQSSDEIIYDGAQYNPQRRAGAYLTEDERYLVLTTSVSTTGNELYLRDLANKNSKLIPVVTNFDNNHSVIDNDGSRLVIQTNLNAPNERIVEVNFDKPQTENWKDIVPEQPNLLMA